MSARYDRNEAELKRCFQEGSLMSWKISKYCDTITCPPIWEDVLTAAFKKIFGWSLSGDLFFIYLYFLIYI